MYVRLLSIGLGGGGDVDADQTPGQALVNVLRCRSKLVVEPGGHVKRGVGAIADELEYDIALIRFARLLGIPTDASSFSQPGVERERLERELELHGIRVDQLNP
jgi:hypothetical protein